MRESRLFNPRRSAVRAPYSALAAAVSGIVAGTVATFAQMVLWWLASYPLPETLWRDSRLAAAIVLGPTVLPPPADFDVNIMLTASLLHFALSALYGAVQAGLTRHVRSSLRILAGIVFGLLVYVVNMYGFTQVYPWFEVSRDWVTVAAHAVFGLSAALVYDAWVKHWTRPNTKVQSLPNDD